MDKKIQEKANYCLNCPSKPCQQACPLHIDIPAFIQEIKKQNYEKAYEIIGQSSIMPSICGRICPHMKQCQSKCVRGIKGNPVEIGELEAFVGDTAIKNNYQLSLSKEEKNCTNKKIAIIGGGPAGITCASYLAYRKFNVTIYEKHNYLGGILVHGIPEFRLEKNILNQVIDLMLSLGVKVEYNKELGNNLQIEDLLQNYDNICLTFGANEPIPMNTTGNYLEGIYEANKLLEYNLHPDYKNKKAVIIGGGNVALDCARTISKKGAQSTTIIYRRSEKEMPAEKKEIEDAKKEGIKFVFQTRVNEIISDKKNKVAKIECIKTELIQKGNERPIPVDILNSNYLIDVDYVITAIGSKPDEEIIQKLKLEKDSKGYIKVNNNYQTSNPKIYAGGDLIDQKKTVAWASNSGRQIAQIIQKNLK